MVQSSSGAASLCSVKHGLATLAALGALVAAAPAHASTPIPWCGTSPSAVDRLPDTTPGYAVHVAYVHPADSPDRFAQWAPRIVGDIAAIDAWWRAHDPNRAPRFDIFATACATTFGQLDLSNVTLPQSAGGIDTAFTTLRFLLAEEHGFLETEKAYLIYYDGLTGQSSPGGAVCGQGGSRTSGLPGLAAVFLDSCGAEATDTVRPVVAVHELLHVFGAVAIAAPHSCRGGHVCDVPEDLMTASLSGSPLESLVLDAGRDDYYDHPGGWLDARDSLFLERLDSPDRAPPSTTSGLTATNGNAPGLVRLTWRPATDDVGPVSYRVYQDGSFVAATQGTSTQLSVDEDDTSSYSVRAADSVGHLGPLETIRFKLDVGIVDARGRLVRDTVRPPGIRNVSVRRTSKSIVLTWPAVRDGGGLRGYRARIGTRTIPLTKPALTLSRARVTSSVSLAAVDRAGNVGPTITVARTRLR
jgi:hypothetical protein